jgi:hypothetical protein
MKPLYPLTRTAIRLATLFLLFLTTFGTGFPPSTLAPAHAAGERIVEMEGVATWAGDEEKARLAAINDAKWRAVRQVLGHGVGTAEVNDYVKTYRVIGGGREGERYVVRLAVTVLGRPDSQIDKKMLRWGGNPRIMVVIPETSFGRRIPDPAAETELIKNLTEAGFRVIESSDVARIRYSTDMNRIIKEADIAAMKRMGAKYHCDILIAGEAFSDTVNSPMRGYNAAEARVEAKAFIVDTGEILAADGESAGGSALSESVAHKTALKNSATLLCDYFVPRIKEKITAESRTISIRLTGVRSSTQLYNLQAALMKVAGVSSVQRRNYVTDRLVANLDVETNLLTDQLSRQLELIKNPRLKVVSSTGQKIEVRVMRASQ